MKVKTKYVRPTTKIIISLGEDEAGPLLEILEAVDGDFLVGTMALDETEAENYLKMVDALRGAMAEEII